MRHLKATDHRRMPWKNGKGETVEIAVFPEGAGLADFGWRLSMARVDEPGPFSCFENIDRTLAIVEGAGLRLFVDGDILTVSEKGPAAVFPGDARIVSDLFEGAVTDLNLMTRRGRFRGRISRVCQGDASVIAEDNVATRIILALAPCTVSAGGQSYSLGRLDACRIAPGEAAPYVSGTDGLDLLVVTVLEEDGAIHKARKAD